MGAENLHLVIRRKGNYVTETHVVADPDDHAAIRDHLLRAIRREGWGEHHIPDFTCDVYREHQRGLYKTITA